MSEIEKHVYVDKVKLASELVLAGTTIMTLRKVWGDAGVFDEELCERLDRQLERIQEITDPIIKHAQGS